MKLQYALLVTAAPGHPSAPLALHFAQSLLEQGHALHSVFFFGDGVNHANTLITPPQDEMPLWRQWQALGGETSPVLNVCISSALRRGVADEGEAQRYELGNANLADGFSISGLGQWVEACLQADRVLQFGGQ